MSDHKFEPKPDITAYELAQLVARILKIASHLFVYELPLELQRHFKLIE